MKYDIVQVVSTLANKSKLYVLYEDGRAKIGKISIYLGRDGCLRHKYLYDRVKR